MGFCTSNGAPSPAIDAAAANFSAHRVGPRSAAHRPDDASHRRESAIPFVIAKKREPTETFSERTKSGRSIVIPDWRGTGDLAREYALVYRAGLLNQTGRPVGVGLPDKLYDFAHLVTSAGNL